MSTKEKIVIAGGSGFIGKALAAYFKTQYNVVILSRHNYVDEAGIKYVYWDGKTLGYWKSELEGITALINMTGRSVDCRYNQTNKDEIYNSRLNSTYILGKAIEACSVKPKVWLNSSSATIYRHAEDRPMTEDTGDVGKGFSVDVCKKWEQMFNSFSYLGIRQVALRTAIVLGKNKGVMVPFTNLVKFGLGGQAANGKQMFSWIHIDDVCRAIDFLIHENSCKGAYNIAAPNPITNKVFMDCLRKQMHVPFGLAQPKWLLEIGARLIKTETELLLKSRWVVPERLQQTGFTFSFSTIENALQDLVMKR